MANLKSGVVAPDSPDSARRIVTLQGAFNVRDLGGYAAANGRTVRWGCVYRSAALGSITQNDTAILLERGVRVICDLRSGDERIAAPNAWVAGTSIEIWEQAATETVGDSKRLLEACLIAKEETRETLMGVYREMPFAQSSAYAQIFSALVAGRMPLLFHCAAGKDRSGVASALLLSVLGVPAETVLSDYLLSNQVRDRIREAFVSDARHAAAARDPALSWMPLTEADPIYLAAMFAEVLIRCGGIEGYCLEYLRIGPNEIAKLRANLLE
jgi:protein-tyrosine phosphatase